MIRSYVKPLEVETLLGEVVWNKDNTGGNRVKVNLFGYTDGIPVDVLPFYPVKTTPSNPNTTVTVPTVGTYVLVSIEDSILNGTVVELVSNIPPM